MTATDFSSIIKVELTDPIIELCHLFAEEKAHEPFVFFSGVLNLLHDPEDEALVLAATIELSKCAFLGFQYTPEAQNKINAILDSAINIAHTMSASAPN